MKTFVVSLVIGSALVGSLTHCSAGRDRPPPAGDPRPDRAEADGGDGGGRADEGEAGAERAADGGVTVSRVPVVLATGQNVNGIAVGQGNVYWTSFTQLTQGHVRTVPLAGGTTTTLADNQVYPDSIAVDASSVYWANQTRGQLMKVARLGGTPVTVAEDPGTAFYGVAVDATNVYWTSYDSVFERPLLGGDAVVLATGQAAAGDVVVDPTTVYWRVSAGLMKVPIAGGTPSIVVQTASSPMRIAVDAANLYWTEVDSGKVMKVPVTGGSPTTLATGQEKPWGIAIDATDVYWVTFFGGTVMRVPIAGGSPTMLASKQKGPVAIAVTATSVVWGSFASGNGDGDVSIVSK